MSRATWDELTALRTEIEGLRVAAATQNKQVSPRKKLSLLAAFILLMASLTAVGFLLADLSGRLKLGGDFWVAVGLVPTSAVLAVQFALELFRLQRESYNRVREQLGPIGIYMALVLAQIVAILGVAFG